MAEPSVFTRIISGEWSGHFVWRSNDVVAIMTIAPIRPGHVLVIPARQVDRWTDLDAATWAEVTRVAHVVGSVMDPLYPGTRVGVIVAGMEVPHCHVHLIPVRHEGELSFALAETSATPESLAGEADRIRAALTAAGHNEASA